MFDFNKSPTEIQGWSIVACHMPSESVIHSKLEAWRRTFRYNMGFYPSISNGSDSCFPDIYTDCFMRSLLGPTGVFGDIVVLYGSQLHNALLQLIYGSQETGLTPDDWDFRFNPNHLRSILNRTIPMMDDLAWRQMLIDSIITAMNSPAKLTKEQSLFEINLNDNHTLIVDIKGQNAEGQKRTLRFGCVAGNSWRTNAPITGCPMGLMISRSYKNYVMPTSHRLIQKCRKYRGCSPSTIADNTALRFCFNYRESINATSSRYFSADLVPCEQIKPVMDYCHLSLPFPEGYIPMQGISILQLFMFLEKGLEEPPSAAGTFGNGRQTERHHKSQHQLSCWYKKESQQHMLETCDSEAFKLYQKLLQHLKPVQQQKADRN